MNQFRVVYIGNSDTEAGEQQLHDKKFSTKEDALTHARSVLKGLQYVQEFEADGTPVETLSKEDVETLLNG